MSTPIGSLLSHYQILEEIGEGGMGVVYLARDVRLQRAVAIKFLADELARDPAARSRFLREARAISSLDHPNICSIYEVDETADGRVYIVMAHYQGSMLDRRMVTGPLSVGEALGIATQVAEGLAKAHARGIVHRDIKPNNLVMTTDGVIKILDFGLAKMADASTLTTTGQVLGTPEYMAPEQWRGESAGPAADVWSVGVLLYGLVTGRVPFKGQNRMAMMYAVLNRDPEALVTVVPRVPGELDAIVRRCLEKDPKRRYADAGQLAAALKELVGLMDVGSAAGPEGGRRGFWDPRSYRLLRKRRVAVFFGIPLIALGLWWGGSRLIADRPEPLRVAVLLPEVSATGDSSEVKLASSAIQSALMRGLAGFKRIAVLDPSEFKNVAGGPAAIASAVSADEVVTASADASRDEWHVRLRWTTKDNTVRWTDEFAVPREDPLILANTVIARLPGAYPRFGRRGGIRAIHLRPEDYATFLNAYRFWLRPTPVELDQKLAILDALHRRAPGFPDAYLLDARFSLYAYQVSRDTTLLERAQRAAERARSLTPDDPRAVAVLLDVALIARDFDKCTRRLVELEQLDPGNVQVEYYRALLAEKMGRVDEALVRFTKVIARRPSINYLSQLADMEYRNGRIHLARRHLDVLIRRFPDDVFAYSKLAQVELLYGSAERSDSIYNEVLRRTPNSPAYLNNRGLARMLLRRYPLALEDFSKAFDLNPKKVVYLLNVADCEGLVGRTDSARVHYSRVLELGGSDRSAPALMWRAQCLAHLGKRREAVTTVQDALRIEPEDSEGIYQASLVYALVGDRESALVYARRAIDKGVDPRWFSLSWFDPMRSDSGFIRILGTRSRA